ncbi:MAG TPA: CDP-alcohol phosphatidyltransferase family protein [Gemmatimonadales bacterium]|nr:CDP-alcohol phosphatidyltransferase family protein [Gemmatimonadales bacterium]
MATIYDLKPRFQALLRPLVGALAAAGVTANQVTVGAALLSLATGAAIARWPGAPRVLLLVPLVLFLRMALNAIDGMLAREHGQQSRLGAILNELGDVVSDAALYLPLARVPGLDPTLVVLAVVVAIIGEMTGVVAVQVGAPRRYDGPMGKSDRAFWFGLLALLLGLGVAPGWWCTALVAAIAGLGAITILNRARRALGTA